MSESEWAEPYFDIECENGFDKTFVESGQNGLVNLKFA